MKKTFCDNCGKEFSEPDESPCPKCGSMKKNIQISVHDSITARDELIIGSRSVNINRSVIHADTRNPTDTVKLHNLIEDFVKNNSNELEKFINLLVSKFDSRLVLPKKVFFRGVDILIKDKLASNNIGPPPNPVDGRYNNKNEKCLYLIDSIECLPHELNSTSLLLQEYHIPFNELIIADLSPSNSNLHNSLSLAFDMSERGLTSSGFDIQMELEKRNKSRYCFSQLLSSVFKRYGWEGLFIPGVHGKNMKHYHNLVIFTPKINGWTKWTCHDYIEKHFTEIHLQK